ncbi:MAG: hypothetical protein ACKO1U_01435, partial [Bacteroidota bacterium]
VMKNNASLRLAKAALACALFGTMFTSCSKEEEISPLSDAAELTGRDQTAILTDDQRQERINGAVLDERGYYQTLNNEQGRLLLGSAGEVTDGDRLLVKCTKTKCAVIKVPATGSGLEWDDVSTAPSSLHNEVSRSIAGANQITDGDRFIVKCSKSKCDLIKLPVYQAGIDAEAGIGPRHLQSLNDFAK